MLKGTKVGSSIALMLEIGILIFITPSWRSFPRKFAQTLKVSRGCKIQQMKLVFFV